MDELTRKRLTGEARTGSVDAYLTLLAEMTRRDAEATAAAKRRREELDLVIAIAMTERPEVPRKRISRITGVPYRALFKRRDAAPGNPSRTA